MMMFGRIMTLSCRAERGRKSVQDLVWFGLMLNVPVNTFSVMLGRSHRFLYITSILGCKYALLKDTTRRPEWGSNPRLLDPESVVLTTRPPRPHQVRRTRYDNFINVAKHSEMCWIPLSAGLGIVAFTEGLHNSSIYPVTPQV